MAPIPGDLANVLDMTDAILERGASFFAEPGAEELAVQVEPDDAAATGDLVDGDVGEVPLVGESPSRARELECEAMTTRSVRAKSSFIALSERWETSWTTPRRSISPTSSRPRSGEARLRRIAPGVARRLGPGHPHGDHALLLPPGEFRWAADGIGPLDEEPDVQGRRLRQARRALAQRDRHHLRHAHAPADLPDALRASEGRREIQGQELLVTPREIGLELRPRPPVGVSISPSGYPRGPCRPPRERSSPARSAHAPPSAPAA